MALGAVERKAGKIKTAALAIAENIQIATELILKDGARLNEQ